MSAVQSHIVATPTSSGSTETPIPDKTTDAAVQIFKCMNCGQTHENYKNHLRHHWCLQNTQIEKLAKQADLPEVIERIPIQPPLSFSPPLRILSQQSSSK